MSLYDAMFAQYGVKVAQVLVTKPDFYNEETRKHLFSTLSELISLNIVPIINTNDAVSPPMFVVDEEVVLYGQKRVCIPTCHVHALDLSKQEICIECFSRQAFSNNSRD